MCFGENAPPASTRCKFCGLEQSAAGWTVWRKYAELPEALQRRIDRSNGPKVLTVLRTRWEAARASAVAEGGEEAELGTAGFDAQAFAVPGV